MKPVMIAATALAAVLMTTASAATITSETSARTAAPRVAAASSLRAVWPALMDTAGGTVSSSPPPVSFGSTGDLTRQLLQGAPYELFLAADETHVERLVEAGLGAGRGETYALGTLSLVLAAGQPASRARLPAYVECLEAGECRRLALANPRHAPYGIAAMQALDTLGLLDAARPQLVYGQNASQALQFALLSVADAALVPTALLRGDGPAAGLPARLVPPRHYDLVRHRLLRLADDPPTRRLTRFLLSARAAPVWRRFGFRLPD